MTAALQKDIIEWDVLNWAQALKHWQPVINTLPRDANILAIGERNGGLSLWLALQGFHVICTDRTIPADKARLLHEQYGVADRITYQSFDVMHPDISADHFDLVIMKSVLGGLKADYHDAATRNSATQQLAIQNIHSLLKIGGYLLTADNMKGNLFVHLFRRIKHKEAGWHYFSQHELKQLLQPFQYKKMSFFGVIPTLFPSHILNTIAFCTNRLFLQWLPPNTQYIGITIARK